jgi:phage repressor protein C with HTH and peptisase S24 domain
VRWPFGAALVVGPSMRPTLRHGDAVLVWRGLTSRGPRVRPGDVVVARFRSRPDLVVVKRVDHRCPDGGWWLRSDNAELPGDSRTNGAADVVGRVVWRYWPPLRRAVS